jgi:hypothetical protein
LSIPDVPRNVVPVVKIPATLKVEDKSTCTFCARAGMAKNRNAITNAATGAKNTDEDLPLVIILPPSNSVLGCILLIA